MADISIGELARRSGVKVPTIRYYEQAGLLPIPGRTEGHQRRYGRAAVGGSTSSVTPANWVSRWPLCANCWRSASSPTALAPRWTQSRPQFDQARTCRVRCGSRASAQKGRDWPVSLNRRTISPPGSKMQTGGTSTVASPFCRLTDGADVFLSPKMKGIIALGLPVAQRQRRSDRAGLQPDEPASVRSVRRLRDAFASTTPT
jgi:hypothetical protein